MRPFFALGKRLSAVTAASALAATAWPTGYSVERVEPIEDWPLSWVSYDQNDREDYTIRYGQTGNLTPKTVAVIAGSRYLLNGFSATDINNLGVVCGRLMLTRTGVAVGVTWSPATGYVVLEGSSVAYPHKIADDGTIGGSINHFYTSCVWRGGVPELIPGAQGFVGALHPSGMVAGYFPDGGHGSYPWIYENGVLFRPTPSFSINKAFADRRLLGNTVTSYYGRALIYDPDTQQVSYLPGGDNNIVGDMNESGVAVGILSFGKAWETSIPNIWKRVAPGVYTVHNPYDLIERGWSDLSISRITGEGTILGRARRNGGQLWLVRLRPLKRG